MRSSRELQVGAFIFRSKYFVVQLHGLLDAVDLLVPASSSPIKVGSLAWENSIFSHELSSSSSSPVLCLLESLVSWELQAHRLSDCALNSRISHQNHAWPPCCGQKEGNYLSLLQGPSQGSTRVLWLWTTHWLGSTCCSTTPLGYNYPFPVLINQVSPVKGMRSSAGVWKSFRGKEMLLREFKCVWVLMAPERVILDVGMVRILILSSIWLMWRAQYLDANSTYETKETRRGIMES